MKTPSPEVLAAPASPGLIRFVSEIPPGPHHAAKLWSTWNFIGYFDDPCEESQAVFRHRLMKAGMTHLSSYRLVKQPRGCAACPSGCSGTSTTPRRDPPPPEDPRWTASTPPDTLDITARSVTTQGGHP